jgi:tetratricopeptide (TPR) repeat protein
MPCRRQSFLPHATLLLVLSLLPGALLARSEKVPADQAQAEKWIMDATHRMYRIDQLNSQYLTYSSMDGQYHFGIALARISSIQAGIVRDGWYTTQWQDYAHDNLDYIKFLTRGRAESFATALEFLATGAREEAVRQHQASLEQFRAQAKVWRESAVKPAMPEAAREHQVLAEYAFKQRETEKAVREYKAALDIFPTWPEGQYNLATLAGEQKDYDSAILHMQEYLELVPDSPDTQAAKDSIIIWKDRLNTVNATAQNSGGTPRPKKGSLFNVSQKR